MIFVNEPVLGDKDLEYVTECLRTGWVSSQGKFVQAFEERWSSYCGRRYGVAVSNGTLALEIAVSCLDLRPGDEVIMPAFTIISCPLAVIRNGGTPVLVDSDPDTWCMDVSQVESKITARTRAIMPVHIYGHPVDMDPILELAAKHDLVVVEDAAEAHGAEYRGRRCGQFGDLSCFSFGTTKIVVAGEGGMVLTDDRSFFERMQNRRNFYFGQRRKYHHAEIGTNGRLTNMQAALGLAQAETIDARLEAKRRIAAFYDLHLRGISEIQRPTERAWAKSVYWVYGLVLDERTGMDALAFADRLERAGIQTSPFFFPMHQQPALRRLGLFGEERHPVAEKLGSQGLYLPSGAALSEDQLRRVCEGVRECLAC